MSATTIAARLAEVRGKVDHHARLAGRVGGVRLIAVGKTKPLSALMEAYAAGQRHFGENYVQELVEKAEKAPDDIQWHFIGSLQSNKVKSLVQAMAGKNLTVESVGTTKLVNALNKAAHAADMNKIPVFIQVNTSGEESKSGCHPEETLDLAKHVLESSNLMLRGLMTIGALDYSPNPACLKRLVDIRSSVAESLGRPVDEFELSMGMSGDFEEAIKLGSTSVRVGSTIFGARDYSKK